MCGAFIVGWLFREAQNGLYEAQQTSEIGMAKVKS